MFNIFLISVKWFSSILQLFVFIHYLHAFSFQNCIYFKVIYSITSAILFTFFFLDNPFTLLNNPPLCIHMSVWRHWSWGHDVRSASPEFSAPRRFCESAGQGDWSPSSSSWQRFVAHFRTTCGISGSYWEAISGRPLWRFLCYVDNKGFVLRTILENVKSRKNVYDHSWYVLDIAWVVPKESKVCFSG